jgi:hypothetical protein
MRGTENAERRTANGERRTQNSTSASPQARALAAVRRETPPAPHPNAQKTRAGGPGAGRFTVQTNRPAREARRLRSEANEERHVGQAGSKRRAQRQGGARWSDSVGGRRRRSRGEWTTARSGTRRRTENERRTENGERETRNAERTAMSNSRRDIRLLSNRAKRASEELGNGEGEHEDLHAFLVREGS